MSKVKAIEFIRLRLVSIASVEPFGSFVTDTSEVSDDVDLAVLFHQDPPGWIRNCKGGKIPPDVVRSTMKRITNLLPHSSVSIKLRVVNSKTPIIKVVVYGNVRIDLVLHDAHGVFMSRVLADLFHCSGPIVLQLVRRVKTWAKSQGLIDASRGNLSSYAFTLLTVHFLQRAGLAGLVSFNTHQKGDIFDPIFEPREIINVRQCKIWTISAVQNCQYSLNTIFVEFLKFLLDRLDTRPHLVRDLSGREEFCCCCCLPEHNDLLFILEPISRRNVSVLERKRSIVLKEAIMKALTKRI